jgi:pyruvate oxidase
MLTGLYDAKLDQPPVLAISGQVPSKVLGRGAFQDLDLTTVFRDVAAWTTPDRAVQDHPGDRRRPGGDRALSTRSASASSATTSSPRR